HTLPHPGKTPGCHDNNKYSQEAVSKTFQLRVNRILVTPCVVAALVEPSEEHRKICGHSESGRSCEEEDEEKQEEGRGGEERQQQQQKQQQHQHKQEFSVVGRKSRRPDRGKKASEPANVLSEEAIKILTDAVQYKLQVSLSQLVPGFGCCCPGNFPLGKLLENLQESSVRDVDDGCDGIDV
ncbi:hypothetical protein Ahia01_001056200, partial [Argonauta hians]